MPAKKQLNEKVMNKGGVNGDEIIPDPVAKTATLPGSKDQGEKTNPNITAKDCEDITPQDGKNVSADANKSTLNMKASGASAKMEDYKIEVAFEGEDLTEEFKEKAITIFEAAVNAKVSSIKSTLEEEYEEKLQQEITEMNEAVISQIDSYLDYVVEQWMEENEVAIESSLRSEITEEFIDGLRGLFAEHYIEVPDEKLDILEELAMKVEELEDKLNESMTKNIELSTEIKESAKEAILSKMSEGLTLTQKDKFITLAEGVDFTDTDTFEKKLETVKESYFKAKVGEDIIEQEIATAEEHPVEKPRYSGPVAGYVQAISRTSKRI